MNLNHLSDEKLLQDTQRLVAQEREVLIEVLHHLKEIERRRLFSALRFQSLFDYAVRHLGYSEDQACRRIAAMRLLKEVPQIEAKISSGELTLTNIGMAQTLFRKEKQSSGIAFSGKEKADVLQKLEGLSKRAAEKVVLAHSSTPSPLVFDRMKAHSESLIEIKFLAPEALQEKIAHLKGLIAHRKPNPSLAQLFDELCELGFKEWHPLRRRA